MIWVASKIMIFANALRSKSVNLCSSVTLLESRGRDGTHQVTLVPLGGSKAMHEFFVVHCLATDSAWEWDVLLESCLLCTGVRAGGCCPSYVRQVPYRRFVHSSWIAEMKLMLDVLLRKQRYLGRCLADFHLLKSMCEVSRLAPVVAFVYCISCGTCPMFRWEAFSEASPVPQHCYMVL